MRQCDNAHLYDETRLSFCPYCHDKTGAEKTMVLKTNMGVNFGRLGAEYDKGRTVGVFKGKIGIDLPVVFLICISGSHCIADFRLIAGRNFIGRSLSMDTTLTVDDTVSRESQALVTYDAKHNTYSISHERVRLFSFPLYGDVFRWKEG